MDGLENSADHDGLADNHLDLRCLTVNHKVYTSPIHPRVSEMDSSIFNFGKSLHAGCRSKNNRIANSVDPDKKAHYGLISKEPGFACTADRVKVISDSELKIACRRQFSSTFDTKRVNQNTQGIHRAFVECSSHSYACK